MDNKNKFSLLSKECKSILLGSILGDGSLSIHSGYVNARFSMRHSIKQKEYFNWKCEQLKEITGKKSVWESKKELSPSGTFSNPKIRYQSTANYALTDLYNMVKKNKKIQIRRKWLNLMDGQSLAIWWMDDGSLIGEGGRKGVFCTDGFTYKSVLILSRYLKVVWDITTKVAPVSKERPEHYRIWISSTNELKKFLRIILPYIPVKSMLYKTIILYKDPDLQQRWISEVIELSNFSDKEVEIALWEKKQRWKNYR